MQNDMERRSRLVMLAYLVIGSMDLPPPGLSDKEVLMTMASTALKKAAEAVGPPKLPPPQKPRLPVFLRFHSKQEDDED